MTSVQDLVELAAPLGPCAANVADREIRAQGTVGGNLCAPAGSRRPARRPPGGVPGARRAGSIRGCGRRADRLRRGLSRRQGRPPRSRHQLRGAVCGRVRAARPSPHPRLLRAHGVRARGSDGSVRIAVAGVDGPAVRLPSAEAKADDPDAAGEAAVRDVTFADDALASTWYRERTLPVLVRRALGELQEADMKLTVNGVEHELVEPASDAAPLRAPRGARDHEPEGRLPAGRLRLLHRPGRRGAAALVPAARRRARRRGDHDPRRPRNCRRSSRRSRRRSTSATPPSAASAPRAW